MYHEVILEGTTTRRPWGPCRPWRHCRGRGCGCRGRGKRDNIDPAHNDIVPTEYHQVINIIPYL